MNRNGNAWIAIGCMLIVSAVFLPGFLWKKISTPNYVSEGGSSSVQENMLGKSSQDLLSKQMEYGFEENKGQIESSLDILYAFEVEGMGCYLKPNGINYVWVKEAYENENDLASVSDDESLTASVRYHTHQLNMVWEGANEDVEVIAEQPLSHVKHFHTASAKGGFRNVQQYRKVTYRNLYNHIDMVIYFQEDQMKYDFIVHPGGKVSDIQIAYEGQDEMQWQEDGSIHILHPLGSLKEGKPYTYQVNGSDQIAIASEYHLMDHTIGFKVNEYDPSETLVIDPSLKWATYYGGPKSEIGRAVATDGLGNVYVAGVASGYYAQFPTTGAHDYTSVGEYEAFLVKFNASGDRLWSTYFGGDKEDGALAVCTDKFRNVYIAGFTDSNTGIAHNGHDNTLCETNTGLGNRFWRDAFLAKFDEEGDILWATYYGGEDYNGSSKTEFGRAVCTDNDGNVYLAGSTTSSEYIAFNGHDNTFGGVEDAFLVKFSGNGTRLWATYYGKGGKDVANALDTDYWGNVYMAGYTESTNMGYQGFDMFYSGDEDAFLVRFDPDGEIVWATYYGGTEMDRGQSVDAHGFYVYLSGVTSSPSAIAHNGHDNTFNGETDAFLVQFTFVGARIWGTYYGGTANESTSGDDYKAYNSVAVSKHGDLYLAGPTNSISRIATANGYDNTHNGGYDAYLVRFNNKGQRQWGTYYGGDENDYAYGVTTDVSADVYIVGRTLSPTDIAHNGFDNDFDDSENAYSSDILLAKFDPYRVALPGDFPDDFKDLGRVVIPGDEPGLADKGKKAKTYSQSGTPTRGMHHPFKVYPNPAQNYAHIDIQELPVQKAQILVMDSRGSTVFSKDISEHSVSIDLDLSAFPSGLYIVSLQTENQRWSQKLIKN